PISLVVGDTPIPVVVTAQDGTTKTTYTITVTRAASSDATLSNLTISAGTRSEERRVGKKGYAVSVGNGTTSITVTTTVTDATSDVTGTCIEVNSVTASAPISLVVGDTAIPVVVTAQDGTTKTTYTITVTRAASSDATLSNLTISAGT